MKKRIGVGLSFLVLSLFLSKTAKVLANEGTIDLTAVSGGEERCFATSVYTDRSYKVLMTCQNLKMALDPVKNRYVAWVDSGTKKRSLGEIEHGKLSASASMPFERIFITLEKEGRPNKSDEPIFMEGSVKEIKYGDDYERREETRFDSTLDRSDEVDVKGAKTAEVDKTSQAEESTGLGGVLKTIGKVILIGFGLLIAVVGVLSFASRRKVA